MRVISGPSGAVHECGLCGATYGERRAVRGTALEAEARLRGVAPEVWPLARALESMPGFALGAVGGGSAGNLPFVTLVVKGQAALVQLENLTKVLRLAAGRLRCAWTIDVRFEQALAVVLRVADPAPPVRDALVDVEELAHQLERGARLSWWRHAQEWVSG